MGKNSSFSAGQKGVEARGADASSATVVGNQARLLRRSRLKEKVGTLQWRVGGLGGRRHHRYNLLLTLPAGQKGEQAGALSWR